MPRSFLAAALALAAVLPAPASFFPIQNLKPGMRGIGKTVFSGEKIEQFQVEILGVLDNVGPKQSLVLARLSGGPLDRTGVLQGMSGSPVYIDGKLLGAVAMAFPFSKEPIAGIRPINEMLLASAGPPQHAQRASIGLTDTDLTRLLPPREPARAGDVRMIDIATPVSFGGFTRAAIDQFAPQLRALGLEPAQGVTAGGRVAPRMGDASQLEPGAMISVQLMTGDLSIGADGTVTYIDGGRVYAFGHRFLSVGATALPFARSEVVTLLPTLSTSFKISSPREMMGTILQDRNTAVAGELGRRAEMVPVSLSLSRAGRRFERYQMQIVNDRLLSPLLVQMAVFSAIDATERTVGAASFRVTGEIHFEGSSLPVKLNNMYTADSGSAFLVSLSAALPLAYVLQGGFESLRMKSVEMEIESFDEKKQLQIDQVSVGRRQVRPGETVELTTVLTGENGAELSRRVHYKVPAGAPPGSLYFTVADGTTTNLAELRQVVGSSSKSAAQLISTVNSLRANTRAYVRVWRPEPAFQLEGEDLPDPPASVAMILAGSQSALGGIAQTRNAKVAEMEIQAGDTVISGSKTVQVEVKE